MEALVAFATALLAFRLGGRLASRWRERRRPELIAWSGSLLAFAAAAAALAWGAAAGWGDAVFRVYYLFGGLLTAPLLAAGSLLLLRRAWAMPAALVYSGLAAGIVLAEPLALPVAGTSIPDASEHLDLFPARVLAVAANVLGTVVVVVVAIATLRRRPLGNALILAGVAVAAVGSALFGLGEAQTAVSLALAAALLYGGFVLGGRVRLAPGAPPDHEGPQDEHDERNELDDETRRPPVGDDRAHVRKL